mmetsp:Transcript_3663/g.6414  ORF Transcript_3663/g.6414 Transcript_3663/m.6414 type:complete len:160 (+) Transcript_3663:404-883(+)
MMKCFSMVGSKWANQALKASLEEHQLDAPQVAVMGIIQILHAVDGGQALLELDAIMAEEFLIAPNPKCLPDPPNLLQLQLVEESTRMGTVDSWKSSFLQLCAFMNAKELDFETTAGLCLDLLGGSVSLETIKMTLKETDRNRNETFSMIEFILVMRKLT